MPDFDFEARYQAAMKHRVERDYPSAIRLCTSLLASKQLGRREMVITYELRGTCHVRTKRFAQAEEDFQKALKLADSPDLELEYIHVITSQARGWIQQNRGYAATQKLLPDLEAMLKNRPEPESIALRASVAGLYGVIYFRHGTGWYVHAISCFEKAERLLQRRNDPLRHLRNLSRMSFTLAWTGARRLAWRYAGDMLQLAREITDRGDPQSLFVGRYIKMACLLPVPTKLVLWPFKRHAGL